MSFEEDNDWLRRGRCYSCGSKLCLHHDCFMCSSCGLIAKKLDFSTDLVFE